MASRNGNIVSQYAEDTIPTCPACGRPYAEGKGCAEALPNALRFAGDVAARCRDCGTPEGQTHHVLCTSQHCACGDQARFCEHAEAEPA